MQRNPRELDQSVARPVKDWAGLWFKLMDEEAGEYSGIRFGRRKRGGSELEWSFLPHTRFDGVGGFAHLLRAQGLPEAARELPRLREQRVPTLWRRLWAFFKLLARKPERSAGWRGRTEQGQAAGVPVAWAAHRFDAAQTERLQERARAHGVSLNSLLLWALARAVSSEVEAGRQLWMVPVNMRGPISMPMDTSNHVAYVQVEWSGAEAVSAIHERIRQSLRRREHWGSWLMLNVGRLIGYRGMRKLYWEDRRRGRAWTGALSNLGEWSGLGEGAPEWYFCPPVAQTLPLGAGAITCDGCLSLALQAHETLSREPGWARALLERWARELS